MRPGGLFTVQGHPLPPAKTSPLTSTFHLPQCVCVCLSLCVYCHNSRFHLLISSLSIHPGISDAGAYHIGSHFGRGASSDVPQICEKAWCHRPPGDQVAVYIYIYICGAIFSKRTSIKEIRVVLMGLYVRFASIS